MVEFIDHSVLAQLSHSDMCFPIQYAVTWPERVPNSLAPLDFAKLAKLDFEAPRRDDFPALDLARRAGEVGGTLPSVLNAANEIAVAAFLERRITFPEIWETVAKTMDAHHNKDRPGLDEILAADAWAREFAGGVAVIIVGPSTHLRLLLRQAVNRPALVNEIPGIDSFNPPPGVTFADDPKRPVVIGGLAKDWDNRRPIGDEKIRVACRQPVQAPIPRGHFQSIRHRQFPDFQV